MCRVFVLAVIPLLISATSNFNETFQELLPLPTGLSKAKNLMQLRVKSPDDTCAMASKTACLKFE